jgi:hypothetical protein
VPVAASPSERDGSHNRKAIGITEEHLCCLVQVPVMYLPIGCRFRPPRRQETVQNNTPEGGAVLVSYCPVSELYGTILVRAMLSAPKAASVKRIWITRIS